MDEGQLIEQLINKDEEAFVKVVDLYKKKIVSLCYSYTEERYEAEDLSQEVFIALYKSINNFRGESSLSTYIYRIAVSKCLDFKRKRSFKSMLTGLFYMDKCDNTDLDEKNHVRDIIKKLPEELKTSVVLFYYTGLSQKEIADIMKVPVKTIEGRIYRAKQKIKSELEKEGFENASRMGQY